METPMYRTSAPARQSARIAWIDFSRLFCILTVLELHSPLGLSGGNSLFAGAGCCAFFFLAGFFNNKQGTELLKRCLCLFLFAQVWEIAYSLLLFVHHTYKGIPFDIFSYVVDHASIRRCSAMWFIEYLVFWMLLSPIFRLLRHTALKGLFICGLFALYAYDYYTDPTPDPHSHISYPLSAATFYLGYTMRGLSVRELGEKLFPICPKLPLLCHQIIAAGCLGGVLCCMKLELPCIAPGNNGWWLLPVAYLILALSFYTEKTLPAFTAYCARSGPSIIFTYGVHNSCLFIYVASWILLTHHNPPALLTIGLIAALIIGGTILHRQLKGKFRALDLILFAD